MNLSFIAEVGATAFIVLFILAFFVGLVKLIDSPANIMLKTMTFFFLFTIPPLGLFLLFMLPNKKAKK